MELEDDIKEELFCLKFEIDALSEVLIHNHAERWIYKMMYPQIEEEHLARYHFAKKYVADKTILDIAGGCGYGALLLANEGAPKEVHSVEINAPSVRYANHRYNHKKITRYIDNAELFCKPEHYDLIISFETVEHLSDPMSFLQNMVNSLKPDGTLIISTPITKTTNKNTINPYHVIEWSFVDFQKIVSTWFDIEETYIQNMYVNANSKRTFLKRILNKLVSGTASPKLEKGIVPLDPTIDPGQIEGGYQVLICKKKKLNGRVA